AGVGGVGSGAVVGLHFVGVRDVSVGNYHRPAGDVLLLQASDLFVLGPWHRLVAAIVVGCVGDDVGRAAAARVDAGEDVDAAVSRALGVGHLEGEAAQLLLRRVVGDLSGSRLRLR